MVRNYHHTFDRFRRHVLEPLEPDVFVYGQARTDEDYSWIEKNYRPKRMKLHDGIPPDRLDCIQRYTRDSAAHNMTCQFFNICECNKLKTQFENENGFTYDLVMRVRFDAFFASAFTTDQLEVASSKVLIPWGWNFSEVSPYAKADIFALSTSQNMNIYSSLFERLNSYVEPPFHPESMVGYNLMIHGIETAEYTINFLFQYPEELLGIIPNGYDRDSYRRTF